MYALDFAEDIPSVAHLWPTGQAPYLFPVDPSKYYALFNDDPTVPNLGSLEKLKKRLTPDAFGAVQQSLRFLLIYGDRLFPGFRAICGEFVNEEWLALVDYHKAFHRDHIVHQTQEALVVKRLLRELHFSCVDHVLAEQCRSAPWTRTPPYQPSVTLLDLAAFVLAGSNPRALYLYDYARNVGVPSYLIEPATSAAYYFWRGVVYNAAVTAALYHDIGYPLQFLHTVARKINQSKFTDLIQGGEIGRVFELFDDPLCLMPFRGYRSVRQLAVSHAMGPTTDEAIGRALRDSHGLPGALTFLYLNHQIMDTSDERRNAVGRLTMELAALAITMHDMQPIYLGREAERVWRGQPQAPQRPYMRVSFRRDPVSFILSLADQIQNYGRFSAEFRVTDIADSRGSRTPSLQLDNRIAACRVEHQSNHGTMRIVLRYTKSHFADCFHQHEEFNPKVEANYFDPRLGYLDYADLFDRVALAVEFI